MELKPQVYGFPDFNIAAKFTYERFSKAAVLFNATYNVNIFPNTYVQP